jgi:NarL family two-component system sensor histidine kinase LiaS
METTPGNGRTRLQSTARPDPASLRWSGLQFRMTLSYTLMTVAAVLTLEVLLGGAIWALLTYSSLADDEFTRSATETAQLYALAAAVQAGGPTLDSRTTLEPGRPASITLTDQNRPGGALAISYIAGTPPDPQDATFVLVIGPDGRVVASSFPARYPPGTAVAALPVQTAPVQAALVGTAGTAAIATGQGRVAYAAQPVRSREGQVLGAVYVQVPKFPGDMLLWGFARGWIASGVFWLLLMLPLGALFGLLTTRELVRRLRHLVAVTTRFADGDLDQRVPVSRRDEVGQLEERFNRMAEQLVASIDQRQALAGQNARLAERSRLARDLHDSVKQQAFAVSMQLGAALALFDQDREAARRHLRDAEQLAYHVQQELAGLIQELRPLALQDKRLAGALRDYVPAWSRQYGIAAELEVAGADGLPPVVEEALWRVTQEALSNIARHSAARAVQVTLADGDGPARLTITDNGRGFDPGAGAGAGVGLHSMRERMEALGGTIRVESRAGAGTRITAECPAAVPDGAEPQAGKER